MAKAKELENPNVGEPEEKTPETDAEPEMVMELPPQKKGAGTAIKIVGGLLVAAVFTGLGWIAKGLIGGHAEDDSDAPAEEQATEE
jgi:hypothetical protein